MFWIFWCLFFSIAVVSVLGWKYGNQIKLVFDYYHKFEITAPVMWSLPPDELRKRLDEVFNIEATIPDEKLLGIDEKTPIVGTTDDGRLSYYCGGLIDRCFLLDK